MNSLIERVSGVDPRTSSTIPHSPTTINHSLLVVNVGSLKGRPPYCKEASIHCQEMNTLEVWCRTVPRAELCRTRSGYRHTFL